MDIASFIAGGVTSLALSIVAIAALATLLPERQETPDDIERGHLNVVASQLEDQARRLRKLARNKIDMTH